MRLALLLLLQPTLIGAPVVDEKLDDALWQKAKEALGASPASTIVHSHFREWGWKGEPFAAVPTDVSA